MSKNQTILDKQKTVADATSTIAAASRTYAQDQIKNAAAEKEAIGKQIASQLSLEEQTKLKEMSAADKDVYLAQYGVYDAALANEKAVTQQWGMGGNKGRALNAVDQIKQSFEMDGATLSKVPPRSNSSGLAQVYDVSKSGSGVKQFEYHPGGGSGHQSGAPYYKLVLTNGREIRVIDPTKAFQTGTITKNQTYLNPKGQELIKINGEWRVK